MVQKNTIVDSNSGHSTQPFTGGRGPLKYANIYIVASKPNNVINRAEKQTKIFCYSWAKMLVTLKFLGWSDIR